MKIKNEMDITNNSSVYKKTRKKYLDNEGYISCGYCPYHKGENKNRKKINGKKPKYKNKKYVGLLEW
jgi:hypothetical protein